MKFVCHSEPTFGGGDFWRRKFAEFHSIKFVADSVLFFWGGPLGQKSWEVLQEKIVSSLQHETCIRFTQQKSCIRFTQYSVSLGLHIMKVTSD